MARGKPPRMGCLEKRIDRRLSVAREIEGVLPPIFRLRCRLTVKVYDLA